MQGISGKGKAVGPSFDEPYPSRQAFTVCAAIAFNAGVCLSIIIPRGVLPRYPRFAVDGAEKPVGKPVRYGLQPSSWRNRMRIRASKTITAAELRPDCDEQTRTEQGGA